MCSSDLTLRISNEAKAGRVEADLFDGAAAVAALRKEGLVLAHAHEGAARLPQRYRDRNHFWVAHNEFIFTPAYNSDLVKKAEAPKTFDDLLDPRWKGRMVWSAQPISSGAPGFVGLILATRGEAAGMDYLRKLATQAIEIGRAHV